MTTAKHIRLFLIFSFLIIFQAFSQEREYIIKTSFIEKFARFTEWPSNSLNGNFIISIIGENPFDDALEKMAKKYTISDRPVKIKYISGIDEINRCHVLFISDSEKNNINEILSYTKNKPILTVGETEGFGERGVHFNFYFTKEGTIHFEVNPSKLKQAGLKTDMYLLEFGKIVER